MQFCASFFLCVNSLNSVLFKSLVGHQPFVVSPSIFLCFTGLLTFFFIFYQKKTTILFAKVSTHFLYFLIFQVEISFT